MEGGVETGRSVLPHAADKPAPVGRGRIELQHLLRAALVEVADLEGGDKMPRQQLFQVDGVAGEVGVAGIVDMAVDVGVAVMEGPPLGQSQAPGGTELGQELVLAQRSALGAGEFLRVGQAEEPVGVQVSQDPGGDGLAHPLVPHIEVEVPVHGGPPAAPVPGADAHQLIPVERAVQAVPHPGQHPKDVVAGHHLLPGDMDGYGGVGGGLLEQAQQRRGPAVVKGVHGPGIHPVGLFEKNAQGYRSSLSGVMQKGFTTDGA